MYVSSKFFIPDLCVSSRSESINVTVSKSRHCRIFSGRTSSDSGKIQAFFYQFHSWKRTHNHNLFCCREQHHSLTFFLFQRTSVPSVAVRTLHDLPELWKSLKSFTFIRSLRMMEEQTEFWSVCSAQPSFEGNVLKTCDAMRRSVL